jgi:hypothetical protein
MANLKDSIITNQGLNAANALGVGGSSFVLKYFLPMYDPSIDNTIHSSTQAATSGTSTDVKILSASYDVTQVLTSLEGEKLYNAESPLMQAKAGVNAASAVYSVSPSDNFIITSANNVPTGIGHTGSPNVVLGTSVDSSSQDVAARINLVGGGTSGISQSVSASSVSVSSVGFFAGKFHMHLLIFRQELHKLMLEDILCNWVLELEILNSTNLFYFFRNWIQMVMKI